ncbi:helix-turn-helix domain-containing protein [Streptomyces sp. ISL-112]|uniref:helix-turn-helix domain-containing protein n=1 Tax=unclassified Streptomyces TaxID=2593676 RepID=UPI001BECCA0A|nr:MULTISPECIES: helix-turn-helix domain-containing protein [unclassified Streptomyces]MBT2427239.1 helix-turn-helix domain-containing protein [Streptomyces sp. ISL-112]MBT2465729.1 helix-turn-helix domain-containing protein [Streptomyces sp. ISL-63]
MKNSKRGTTPAPPHASTGPAEFGRWLAHRLEDLGYDLSSPRSGGRSAFAEAAGLSPSTVTRLLRGEMPTDPRLLRTLAEAIKEPYAALLVRAGVISPEELAAVQNPTTTNPITPDQAADELGITDPVERKVFINMVRTLARPPAATNGEEKLAD